jgi:hypothetical protein
VDLNSGYPVCVLRESVLNLGLHVAGQLVTARDVLVRVDLDLHLATFFETLGVS